MGFRIFSVAFSCLTVCFLSACSGGLSSSSSASATEDTSASGLAASSVGGALADSDSSSTYAEYNHRSLISLLIPSALATNACPTITSGTGCASNGNAVDLTYSACSFGSSAATWTGTKEVSLINGGAITCGTYPEHGTTHIANNDGIIRRFVSGGSAGTATRTNARGTVVTIDHATANLGNFDTGTTINGDIGGGYGSKVVFDGAGGRKSVEIQERVYSSSFDHSINASLNLSESAGTRTITGGTVDVYHNKLRVIGHSTFTNVVYNKQCCTPVSGTISTTFAAGAHVSPTAAGSLAVGKTETLAFTGCGTATFTNAAGTASDVTLNNCF